MLELIKLVSKFLQVSDKALPTSRLKSSTKSQSVKQHDHEEKKEDEPWLPRTDIVVHRQSERGKTYYFQLEGQNEHIVQVMQKAFDIGKSSVLSVLDSEHCPVSPQGINAIALAALIAAAEKCGYTGGYDIADRLETDWKDKHVALVLSAYGFTADQKSRDAARDLSNSMQLHFGLKDNGDIDPVNPFHHPGLVQFITAAFFSRGIRSWFDIVAKYKGSLFVSSIESKPNELELPQSMLAFHVPSYMPFFHAYSKCEKFPPPNLDAVWNYYMEKLKKLGEKKLMYHKIMHGLYTTVSNDSITPAHGLSTEDIVDGIDWAALAMLEQAEEAESSG
ncbi:hypothetical protein K435DRAFT_972564 [Dendrothele bispora CBS 962.96]|uniref:DUF6532 domain-containing protein n=1 Tax=Dendrothele bispora (strain CBS 962.96) TaxID=1314807 RepID=A0A4S8KYC2_DENBC|nr:hypothetical protein K435DRAFT_972564 [Dendrothele bispora CBS 962.96]